MLPTTDQLHYRDFMNYHRKWLVARDKAYKREYAKVPEHIRRRRAQEAWNMMAMMSRRYR